MQLRIALITILTNDLTGLLNFYTSVLGFQVIAQQDQYAELSNQGVRFAICERSVMEQATGHPGYRERRTGQSFELAFPLNSPEAVDQAYAEILVKGGIPVKAPSTMPCMNNGLYFC
ncbi:MAG: VOC family protein [Calditrichota bacterium]